MEYMILNRETKLSKIKGMQNTAEVAVSKRACVAVSTAFMYLFKWETACTNLVWDLLPTISGLSAFASGDSCN